MAAIAAADFDWTWMVLADSTSRREINPSGLVATTLVRSTPKPLARDFAAGVAETRVGYFVKRTCGEGEEPAANLSAVGLEFMPPDTDVEVAGFSFSAIP